MDHTDFQELVVAMSDPEKGNAERLGRAVIPQAITHVEDVLQRVARTVRGKPDDVGARVAVPVGVLVGTVVDVAVCVALAVAVGVLVSVLDTSLLRKHWAVVFSKLSPDGK